ncbi:hypothetical protein C8R42DRAFT_433437 [Lentinula raphanica]|nr:hypothetical protein C8R42DRAFT_433437 [Lentinula raphanica]
MMASVFVATFLLKSGASVTRTVLSGSLPRWPLQDYVAIMNQKRDHKQYIILVRMSSLQYSPEPSSTFRLS